MKFFLTKNWRKFLIFIFDLITLGTAGWLLVGYFLNDQVSFYQQIQLVVLLWLLTFFTRSIGGCFGLNVYLQGFFWGVGLTLGIGAVLTFLGFDVKNNFWQYAVTLPIVEEISKIFPVILSAWLLFRQTKSWPNPSDWLLMGALSGTAFGLLEDSFGGFLTCWYCFTHYGPHFGDFYFFSDALGFLWMNQEGSHIFGFIGHAASTAFISMFIGLGFWVRSILPRFKKIWLILPAASLVYIILEHMAYNAYESKENFAEILTKFGGGQATPWIFLVGILIVVVIDLVNRKIAIKKSKNLISFFQNIKLVFKEAWSRRRLPGFLFFYSIIKNLRYTNGASWFYQQNRSKFKK